MQEGFRSTIYVDKDRRTHLTSRKDLQSPPTSPSTLHRQAVHRLTRLPPVVVTCLARGFPTHKGTYKIPYTTRRTLAFAAWARIGTSWYIRASQLAHPTQDQPVLQGVLYRMQAVL